MRWRQETRLLKPECSKIWRAISEVFDIWDWRHYLVPQRQLQQVIVWLQSRHEVIDDDQVQSKQSISWDN